MYRIEKWPWYFKQKKHNFNTVADRPLSARLIYIPGIDEKVLEIFHVLCVGTAMLIIDESYRKAMLSNSV